MANPEHVEILKQGVEVWNRWRSENPSIRPDLWGVEMYGEIAHAGINFDKTNLGAAVMGEAYLEGASFKHADLEGTQLTHADLTGANFSWSKITQANFFGSDLTGTSLFSVKTEALDLRFTKLVDADLSEAGLTYVEFDNADLTRTIFNDAEVFECSFGNLDFSKAVGLQYVEHFGPSSIGIETIYKSKGMIPDVFLRGCGVPENFIRHMKSLTMNPIEYYSCFISYSHQDKPFARRLHDQLQARGIRCWLDEKQLLPGDDIYEQVDRGIRMWDKVLLCCSEHSLTSWWVDNEVATTFNKEQLLMKDRKKKVLSLIPLNLDGFIFSDEWESGKRQQIKERLAADFTGWETDNAIFEEQFERIVKALQTEGAREEPPVRKI